MDTPQSNTSMPSRRYVTSADVDELIKESMCRVKGIEYVPPISLKKKPIPRNTVSALETELDLTVNEEPGYVAAGGKIWNPFAPTNDYDNNKGNMPDGLIVFLTIGGMMSMLLIVAIGTVI